MWLVLCTHVLDGLNLGEEHLLLQRHLVVLLLQLLLLLRKLLLLLLQMLLLLQQHLRLDNTHGLSWRNRELDPRHACHHGAHSRVSRRKHPVRRVSPVRPSCAACG